jgi:dipeptidyl aminopeptidase/acylaminoacyl peptidase
MKRLLLALTVLAGLAGLSTPLPAQMTSTAPGFEYFRLPDFELPLVSPGGQSVGFIARTNGRGRLFRLDLATGKPEGIYDAGEGDIIGYWWISDTRVLIAGWGSRGINYFTYDLATRKKLAIQALNYLPVSQVRFFPSVRDRVVIPTGVNTANLAIVDLNTGRERNIGGYAGDTSNAIVSASGELRAQAWTQGSTWHVQWRDSAKSSWHEIKGTASLPTFYPVGMDADDRHLLVIAYDQGDTTALMRLDPVTDQRTIVAQDPGQDIRGLITPYGDMTHQATSVYTVGADTLVFVDPVLGNLHKQLQRSLPEKNCRIVSYSSDRKVQVIANWASGQPMTYYLFANGRLSVLGQARPDLKGEKLGRLETFSFTTRDGLTEQGYVLLPGHGSGPFPAVVRAPGFVRDVASDGAFYNADDQHLASRGYAVINFITRGQNGLGRKFEDAGNLKLADQVVNDLADGIQYLTGRNLIDPKRVAISGYGNGSLFALRAAASDSLYRAVVMQNPGSDLNATNITWQSSKEGPVASLIQQAGGTDAAYAMMRRFDPTVTVPQLRVPVLLACDGTDGREFYYLIRAASVIRSEMNKTRQPCEWYVAKWPDEWRSFEVYFFELNARIADFLDDRLKAPTP